MSDHEGFLRRRAERVAAGIEVAAAIGQVNKLPPMGHNVLATVQPLPPVVHVPSALPPEVGTWHGAPASLLAAV
jgi:hypothetical protein